MSRFKDVLSSDFSRQKTNELTLSFGQQVRKAVVCGLRLRNYRHVQRADFRNTGQRLR